MADRPGREFMADLYRLNIDLSRALQRVHQFLVASQQRGDIRADLPIVATGTQATVAAAILNGAHIVRVHDVSNTIVESNETDNIYRAQFAWTPWGLADQNSVVRPVPPAPGRYGARAIRFPYQIHTLSIRAVLDPRTGMPRLRANQRRPHDQTPAPCLRRRTRQPGKDRVQGRRPDPCRRHLPGLRQRLQRLEGRGAAHGR